MTQKIPHILLADDDLFLQQVYVSELKKAGYKVTAVVDGAQAIRMMRSLKPDIVLLDIIMPIMNGFEVLLERKNDPKLVRIPVIVLSSLKQNSDIKEATKLGANDYFIKSTMDVEESQKARNDIEELQTIIQKLLQK